jgi:hypothetical protein
MPTFGHFGQKLPLKLDSCTEQMRTGKIQKKNDRKFAFLVKDFYKGMSEAGGNIPVNSSYVIAGLVLPNLGKFDAPAFKGTYILPGKQIIG